MARKTHKHHPPVHLHHKVLGGIFVVLGLACITVCVALAFYLMDELLAGSTWELTVLSLCLVAVGLVFFLLAWQQMVVAPKRDQLEAAFRPMRRLPVEDHREE